MNETEEHKGWANRETWVVADRFDSELKSERRTIVELAVARHNEWVEESGYEDTTPHGALAQALLGWMLALNVRVFSPQAGQWPVTDAERKFIGDVGSVWRVDCQQLADYYLTGEEQ